MNVIHSKSHNVLLAGPPVHGRCSRKLPALLLVLLLGVSIVQSQARICNLRYSHAVPSALKNNEQLNITFDYVTETLGGERIFIRPLTAGRPSLGYGASGSPLYTGNGTDTAWFTIQSGKVTVDGLRIEIYNADQSQLIRAMDVPVEFWFGDVGVNITTPTPGTQQALLFNDQVNIQFTYNIGLAGGARIFIRPFSGDNLSPNYSASGSALYVGTGNDTVQFTILEPTATKVDKLRVQVYTDDQSQLVAEYFFPVEYYFGTIRIANVQQTPSPAHIVVPGDPVTFSFRYSTTESAGVRIFLRPFVNGAPMENYAASGSPVYTGSGSNTAFFTMSVFAIPQVVDHVRIQVVDPTQTVTFLDYMMPLATADVSFGTTYLSNIRLFSGPKAMLHDNQTIFLDFNYHTDLGDDVLIFARPFTAGHLTPNYAAHPSSFYPTGSGKGDGFFTISSGDATVDQIRFQVLTKDQSRVLMEFFIPVHYIFLSDTGPVLSLSHGGTGMEITWPSHLGKLYQLQWSLSLSAPMWNDLGNQVMGTGSPMSLLDGTRMVSSRFYRMIVSE